MVLVWLVVFLIAHVNGHANDSFVPSDHLSIPLHRHTDVVDSHGRRLSQASDWPHDAPISHMLGSFFAYLWVGSPPQRVSVIVDTGSHHTAFPCVGQSFLLYLSITLFANPVIRDMRTNFSISF